MGEVIRCSVMFASFLIGDTLRTFEIDLPIVLVLLAPLLLLVSARNNRNAPLIVPAVMLFALGLSSLYVVLVERPTAGHALRNVAVEVEILQHRHDLLAIAASMLVAAILLFVLGLVLRKPLVDRGRKTARYMLSITFGIVYATCAIWLLVAAHRGAGLARHLAEHARP
jgi:hypothetical protein